MNSRDPDRFINELDNLVIERFVSRLERRMHDDVFTRLLDKYPFLTIQWICMSSRSCFRNTARSWMLRGLMPNQKSVRRVILDLLPKRMPHYLSTSVYFPDRMVKS